MFYTKTVNTLCEVILDNGEVIKCTPDHKFMLRDGSYVEAQYLTSETSLMPLYRKISGKGLMGYRLYYEPIENLWHYEHRVFVNQKIKSGYVVHHKDFNKLNNVPENLIVMTKADHTMLHNRNQSAEERKKRSNSIRNWHRNNKDTECYKRRSEAISLSLLKNNNGLYMAIIKILKRRMLQLYIYAELGKNIQDCTLSEIDSCAVKLNRLLNPSVQKRITEIVKQNHKNGKYNNAYKSLKALNDQRKGNPRSDEFKLKLSSIMASEQYKSNRKAFLDSLTAAQRSELFGSAKGKRWYNNGKTEMLCKEGEEPIGYTLGRINHKVISVRLIETDDTYVYDLSIKDNPNFALTAGVFVHNSKDGADGLAGALYNALLHEKDLANDISDLVDIMVETNDVHVSTAEVVHTSEPVIQTDSEQLKLTSQEIIEEAKRRSYIEYNREPVGYRDEDDEPFDPSSGILI